MPKQRHTITSQVITHKEQQLFQHMFVSIHQMECKIILAKLFQTFKFTIVPGSELRYFFDTDLKPLDKTPVYLSRRDND